MNHPLSEDAIDDLLYFARTNSLADLQSRIATLATTNGASPESNASATAIISTARDPHNGNGMLHMASANGHIEIIKYIIALLPRTETPKVISETDTESESSPINTQNGSGNTPLHWAAVNGHLDAVKVLLAAGADAEIVNAAGHDCLYEAEVNGKEEVVGWLLGGRGDGGEGGEGGGEGAGEGGADEGVEEEEEGEAEAEGVKEKGEGRGGGGGGGDEQAGEEKGEVQHLRESVVELHIDQR